MSETLAVAVLRGLVDAHAAVQEAARLVALGAIAPERHAEAAERFEKIIQSAPLTANCR